MKKRFRDMTADELQDLVLDEIVGLLLGDWPPLSTPATFERAVKKLRRTHGWHSRFCTCADCCALWDALGDDSQEPEEPF